MKRIIDGKRYDTATAECVAYVGNDYNRGDFKRESTHLYRSNKGAWFVAGNGGPLSRWARMAGNMWTDGEGIEAVTPHEARMLLEAHNETAEIERWFEIEEA